MEKIIYAHSHRRDFFKTILFVLLITLLVNSSVFAQTHVFVQNNTTQEFNVQTTMPSRQLSKSYWGQTTTKVKPGQRVKILRFNRDKGITNGKFFIFNTTLTAGKDKLIVQQKLRGAFINSHMWQSVKTSKFNDAWYDDRTTHRVTSKLNGVPIKIKYRAFFTGTDDNIEYILEESESNSPKYNNSPEVFDVLTYNVYIRPTTLFKNGQHIRAKLIPSLLSGYDAIVFQEAFDDKARRILLRGLKGEYPYQSKILGTDRGVEQDGGVVIISRWPIITQKQKLFGSVCKGSDCGADKGVLYVPINKKGQMYHLFGTHLQADYGEHKKVIRQQLDIFKRFINHVNPPKSDPVILAGDFNVNSEAKSKTGFNDLLRRLNATRPENLSKLLYSYECNSKNDLANCGNPGGRNYYDHALYSNNHLKPIKSFNEVKLIRSKKGWKEYAFEKTYWDLSDHFPVHGHFEFKKSTNSSSTQSKFGHLKATIKAPSGKVYFFTDKKYYRYNISRDRLEKTANIYGNWKGLPDRFDATLLNPNNKRAYFFKGNKYYKYNFKTGVEYVGRLGVDGWRGVPTHVDAAVLHPNGNYYFFKGSKYYRFNWKEGKINKVGPISNWKGVPNNLDAAVLHTNGKIYFFKGNKYYRYNTKTGVDKVGIIGRNGWKGLSFSKKN